ncbi:MAG: hypothetical protein ACREUZ_16160 [Burkholderiales bacterium]
MPRRTFVAAVMLAAVAGGPSAARAQSTNANDVIAAARKAIGDKTLNSLDTLTIEASVQRHVGSMQVGSETEILLDLPDKYVRTDQSRGPMAGGFSLGFNGDTPIRPAGGNVTSGGGLMIRMGPGSGPGGPQPPEKLSPEEQARADAQFVRAQRAEISRLMLGWLATAHPALNAQYAYAGEAESPDGKADIVDVKTEDGFSARLFIDQLTHLPLMVTYRGPQPRMITTRGPRGGGPAPHDRGSRQLSEEERKKLREDADTQIRQMEAEPPALVEVNLYFDDWRDVGGMQFPHSLRRAVAGTTNEEWTVTRVKVNPRLDAGKFKG